MSSESKFCRDAWAFVESFGNTGRGGEPGIEVCSNVEQRDYRACGEAYLAKILV
jgi:hypothetical protein